MAPVWLFSNPTAYTHVSQHSLVTRLCKVKLPSNNGKGNAGISEQGGITEHLLFQLVWARVSLHIMAMVSDRSQLTCTTGSFPPLTLFNYACVNDLSVKFPR